MALFVADDGDVVDDVVADDGAHLQIIKVSIRRIAYFLRFEKNGFKKRISSLTSHF